MLSLLSIRVPLLSLHPIVSFWQVEYHVSNQLNLISYLFVTFWYLKYERSIDVHSELDYVVVPTFLLNTFKR